MSLTSAKWMMILVVFSLFNLGSSQLMHAQQVDHYTIEGLREQASLLKEKSAANNGAAAEILQKYGVDYTMLSVRSKDGGVELHQKFADIFVILDGSAVLLSGGELVEPKSSTPGEMQGSSILHATSTRLSKGDIVHIPANTPHQLLIPNGSTLTYFVIKVKETE